jgi:hypothetical protein
VMTSDQTNKRTMILDLRNKQSSACSQEASLGRMI